MLTLEYMRGSEQHWSLNLQRGHTHQPQDRAGATEILTRQQDDCRLLVRDKLMLEISLNTLSVIVVYSPTVDNFGREIY